MNITTKQDQKLREFLDKTLKEKKEKKLNITIKHRKKMKKKDLALKFFHECLLVLLGDKILRMFAK